ncbi:hypothetical protein HK405_008798 [Cladochytrium tenue]|nr:hypothetical protein HK405_008798 [Cladochytrium tenue]
MAWWEKLTPAFDLAGLVAKSLPRQLWSLLTRPALLLNRQERSRVFFANVWAASSDGINDNYREARTELLGPAAAHARGVVLDVGAGHGHTLRHLDHGGAVTRYIAVEPNLGMHERLRSEAAAAGIPCEILPMGVEEATQQLSPGSVDTVVCFLTLCSTGRVAENARALYALLRPGGRMLVFEHVRSREPEAASWQRWWTGLWSRWMDGCSLDVDSVEVIRRDLPWKSAEVRWTEDGDEASRFSLFPHQLGIFVKP